VLSPRGEPRLRGRVDEMLRLDAVATTGITVLEVLAGARTEEELERLGRMFTALHPLPVKEHHWLEAARLSLRLRQRGLSRRPPTCSSLP